MATRTVDGSRHATMRTPLTHQRGEGSSSATRRLDRLTAGLARCGGRFQTSIETPNAPFVLLRPVRDAAGGVVDFVYEYANDAACGTNVSAREELVDTRMLERLVQLAPVGLFDAYAAVVETGEPLQLDDFAQTPPRRGRA